MTLREFIPYLKSLPLDYEIYSLAEEAIPYKQQYVRVDNNKKRIYLTA